MYHLPKQILALIPFSIFCVTAHAEIKPLEVSKQVRDQASTGVGYLHAKSLLDVLTRQGYVTGDYDIDAIVDGFKKALMSEDSEVPVDEFKVAMDLFQAKLQERELTLSKKNIEESEKWLLENLKKDVVKSTKSGLQYEVLKKGEGNTFSKVTFEKGKDTRRFQIRYFSATKDGKVFEASPREKFVSVRENLLPGLSEALEMMPEGSHWKLFLKPELAYGTKRLPGKLAPGEIVVMDVFLAKITK